jgi:uncharacterized protein
MTSSTVLALMAKQPQPGRTKTRLCPPFSPLQAAAFYEALLLDTFALAAGLPCIQLAAAVTPVEGMDYFRQVAPPETMLFPVEGTHIGECLARTFDILFSSGFTRVLCLNTDGPSLPPAYLSQAVELLHRTGLVLGPGEDGGYYLIGLTAPCPALFQGVSWSTAQVLAQTLSNACRCALQAALLPPWYDIDTPAAAARLAQELEHLPVQRLVHSRRFFQSYSPTLHPGDAHA